MIRDRRLRRAWWAFLCGLLVEMGALMLATVGPVNTAEVIVCCALIEVDLVGMFGAEWLDGRHG